MKELIILGTGVHAAEMAEIIERINDRQPMWDFLGYLAQDETSGDVGREINGYPVLGTTADLFRYPDACFVPDNDLKSFDPIPIERMTSLVDPSAFVSRTAVIGRGCVIYPNSFIGLRAKLDDYVFALSGCTINHDANIGKRVILASGVSLAGHVRVGDRSYLGQSCSIRQFVNIGAGSLIGMGSIVVKDVAAGSVIAGNPGKKLDERK